MAAGLGFKTFTTGEVLTAADVNGYLMQGVLVFASAAARNAAITSPQEGQFAFTKDTNGLWYYDGAAWVASGATGDIEGVTAGVGISGGGTSGTVTITNDMATTITASGDIVVGTGSGTYDNVPIGTTGQVLTADTTVSPYKVKWATPASGGGKLLQVVQASYAGQISSATGVYADTGLTATTGALATTGSRVKIDLSMYVSPRSNVAGNGVMLQLLRGSTVLTEITHDAGYNGQAQENRMNVGFSYVDSPGTTSATTYKVQYANAQTATGVYFSVANTPCYIILSEIGA